MRAQLVPTNWIFLRTGGIYIFVKTEFLFHACRLILCVHLCDTQNIYPKHNKRHRLKSRYQKGQKNQPLFLQKENKKSGKPWAAFTNFR